MATHCFDYQPARVSPEGKGTAQCSSGRSYGSSVRPGHGAASFFSGGVPAVDGDTGSVGNLVAERRRNRHESDQEASTAGDLVHVSHCNRPHDWPGLASR